jgi:ribosomal protein S20
MAITHAAKKDIRKNLRRQTKNTENEQKMKKLLKEVRDLVSQKKIEEAKKLLPQVYKVLDKSVKTGLIKKGTSSRKKSRIIKSLLKPAK